MSVALLKNNVEILQEILSIPEKYRPTYLAVISRGRTIASKVAEITGRLRSVECDYANNLVALGYLDRERIGRYVFYTKSLGKKDLKYSIVITRSSGS